MGSTLDSALEFLLQAEGGYTIDQGGRTMYGISERSFPHMWGPEPGEAGAPTLERAKQFYTDEIWNKLQLGQIAVGYPRLAISLFDAIVNGGGVELLQELVATATDGKLGPETIGAIPAAADRLLADTYNIKRDVRFRLLAGRGGPYERDLQGWLNRVAGLRRFLRQRFG